MHDRLPDSRAMREIVPPPPFVVTRIAERFDFVGQGTISGTGLEAKTVALMDEAIDSPDILVPVEAEDDGCSDGRPAILVFRKQETFKRSLNRPKVFGGAVAMTAASRIGLGLTAGESLNEVFEHSIGVLTDRDISFGAHTDEQAQADDCGCGAIDRAPEALLAALKYEDQIRAVITLLGVDPEGLDDVFGNFRGYVRDELSLPVAYSGRQVMDGIVAAGKVVKQLGGPHLERRILLNQVRGYTVNQKLIRWVTGDKAQVFAIDTWRLQDIAAGVYPDDPDLQHRAVLSGLVYTVATAAVLTKGDLPVDMIETTAS